ncbi:SDR family oxidoreductase [Vibrio sp. F13]|uniref:NAD-dependent epimerase/dehydratase family protein n=1 Tax=Vibrio sp. F13 TaxID=2070777 RepID=UPI0010BD4E25|nr:SDR family oxidoreductase [Vibrio sp. F13]TKF69490.1 SDR family oxidoreductase [Vibrio sp. F13]
MSFTVIGGNGFIGSEIVRKLKDSGFDVWVPKRNDPRIFSQPLGVLIYCAGYGECDESPTKVIESNTTYLNNILDNCHFNKIIYLSSTRIYMNQASSEENSDLKITFDDSRSLFNLTKLVSEELLRKSPHNYVIVRPSNTYGLALKSPLFLPSIVRNAVDTGVVNMYVEPSYSKDYVSVEDIADVTIKLALRDNINREIYNLASGENVSAEDIANILEKETACEVKWHKGGNKEIFPVINIKKIKNEFEFSPRSVLEDLSSMINSYKLIKK